MLRNATISSDPSESAPAVEASDAQPTEFQLLIDQVRAGSQDAAWKLIELYGPHIQRVVRRKLIASVRSKFDSMDFVQLVWLSFFRERSQIISFRRPEQLVMFLAAIANHKVIDETRRLTASLKYDVRRERPLTAATSDNASSRNPTPSQFAIAKEAWNQLLSDQPDHYRQIVQMKYSGNSNREIADAVGLHVKTVRRILEKLFPASV